MDDPSVSVIANPWHALRQFTQARIALGRSGVSVPTSAQLAFQLDHARARDAVHLALDAQALAQTLALAGHECITVHSAAPDRQTYLRRPDLGRQLDAASRRTLEQRAPQPCDLALVVADGLSALAIEQNVQPFLELLLARLGQAGQVRASLAPIVIATQARVAIGDEIGQCLNARAVVVLIGERPGLSSPDSMGLYLTWAPRVGMLDASRNCISNVRPAGLSYEAAAYTLHYLLSEARKRGSSGLALKDETLPQDILDSEAPSNFLLKD